MKNLLFRWNEEKNLLLKESRGVSFEDVVLAIQKGDLLEIIPNSIPKNKSLLSNCHPVFMTGSRKNPARPRHEDGVTKKKSGSKDL